VKRLVERVGVRRLLPTVTVLFVLCLAVLGVLLYRLATVPPSAERAGAANDGAIAATYGKFTPLAEKLPAPDLNFAAQSGKSVALADFRGRLVLINLWATWCAPCVQEMPSLARLQARMPELAVLAVSEDRQGDAAVAPFVAKLGLAGLGIYLDPKNEAVHALKVDGLPTSILIGRDGKIDGKLEGAADWDSQAMLALLRRYAAAAAQPPAQD
jgi:thiol-disulfide isomerase/thioredoxin